MVKTLETERLILRAFSRKDAEALFAYAKNPNVGPHAGWKPHANARESRRIIVGLFLSSQVWAIVDKETGTLIGSIGLEADKRRPGINSKELGYSLAEEYWGRGIMTEAAKRVIQYAFEEMQLDIVAICTGTFNDRSSRVIEKCGFKYEGTERYCYLIYDGNVRSSKCYSLLRSEWEEQNN
ncbi:GNAT family N-acetyltransferase [Clostridium aminobutyricum]|uniref:GNAT family N-acetyltransferase n=1 Tax=Clostridium aminobutyricum TaxID=33953 RepID=A0A939DAY7_CLOAM|nr:GNAT family protein [Clostridium aminobutyricum]MBN7774482.1 GNAT family N-acetyltransferase [Clostridium aminobutyricum]